MGPSNNKENQGPLSNEGQDYQFMKEHIKDCKKDRPAFWKQIIKAVILAAIFGFVACLVFFGVKPLMEKQQPEEEPEIVIPSDEVEEAEPEPTPEPDTVYITETIELTDYQALQYQQFAVGKQATSALAVVTGVSNDVDWFNDSYQNSGAGTGVVFMKNDSEIFLLTNRSVVAGAESIAVTFNNGESAQASIKSSESNTDIAVIAVATENLSEDALNYIKALELGNSNQVTVGAMVVAIGSPNGENNTVMTGSIINNSRLESFWDVNYKMLSTDIMGSAGGEGVLLNMDGQIIGLINQRLLAAEDSHSQITVLPISELKSMLEKMANQRQIPHLGIKGNTVTDAIANEHNLPTGFYVKDVQMDSPAMSAGIQEGDVIVALNGRDIPDEDTFEESMALHQPEDTITILLKRLAADGTYQDVECQAVLTAN